MPTVTAPASTARAIDAVALARGLQRQARAAAPPWLHGEVARRMAERLPVVKRVPAQVIDWGGAAAASESLLRQAYPRARLMRLQSRPAPAGAAPWWSPRRWRGAEAVAEDALAEAQAGLVWANMVLHWAIDPAALIARWRRALEIDGFLMFSTLGPDTLKTLRAVYREAGWGVPHAPFVDMHDLGDMLVQGGFADPVMDQELLRLTWDSPRALLAELRTLGINADRSRHAGLRTPRWRARLEAALAARAGDDGRIALEFEIVYGHAFKPPPRASVAAETRVAVDELQRMARSRRRDAPDRQ